jgi:DNA polymerase
MPLIRRRLEVLDGIERKWNACEDCALSEERNSVVHWRGDPTAPLFVIGEAPGADEDRKGRPFVGPAGRLLDTLFHRANVRSEHVFITNMVACRPPANRKPTHDELRACSGRLHMLLKVVRPKALLLLGSTAGRLAGITSITAFRGEETNVELLMYDGEIRSWPAIATFHPSYILRAGGLASEAFTLALGDVRSALKLALA